MGLWKGTKRVAGHIVDLRVTKWVDLSFLKASTRYIATAGRRLFTVEHAEREETFEQALERLNLTEEDLKQREQDFTKLFIFFLCLTMAIFIYSVYIALNGNFMGFLVGLAITLYGFSQTFRYHFWLFQIKHRKLGCTWHEWLNSKVDPNDSNKDPSE